MQELEVGVEPPAEDVEVLVLGLELAVDLLRIGGDELHTLERARVQEVAEGPRHPADLVPGDGRGDDGADAPQLVLEHPDRQDAVGLPLVRVGVERGQGERRNTRSPPPPGPAGRAGSLTRSAARGLRARPACPRTPGGTGPGSRAPGAIGDRGARPRRPGPGSREGAPRPGRACGRPVPTTPSSSARHVVRGTVGNGAHCQRGKPGAPGPGEDVRALHVHGQRALRRPPLRLCRRAGHDVVHREEPPDPVAKPGGIEGASGPAPKAGIPAVTTGPRSGNRHRVANDDVARPEIRPAPAREPGHEQGGGRRRVRADIETVEEGRARTHDPDGQEPPGGRRQAPEQPAGLHGQADDDEDTFLERGARELDPCVTAPRSRPPGRPSPPASGRAMRRRTSRPRCPFR